MGKVFFVDDLDRARVCKTLQSFISRHALLTQKATFAQNSQIKNCQKILPDRCFIDLYFSHLILIASFLFFFCSFSKPYSDNEWPR